MIYHVSTQHIHPRRVVHGDNSRGVPNNDGGAHRAFLVTQYPISPIAWAISFAVTNRKGNLCWSERSQCMQ